MALTIDSTLGELLANEEAKAILEKHVPGLATHPQLAMAKGFALKAIAPMSQGMLPKEKLDAITEDLAKL